MAVLWIFGELFFVCLIIFFIYSQHQEKENNKKCTYKLIGKIVHIEEQFYSESKNNSANIAYKITFEVKDGENIYYISSKTFTFDYTFMKHWESLPEIGDICDIYVNPDNPEYCIYDWMFEELDEEIERLNNRTEDEVRRDTIFYIALACVGIFGIFFVGASFLSAL